MLKNDMEASKPVLIEVAALNLQAPDQVIVDVRDASAFAQGHIPGAVQIAPASLVGGVKPATGKLPSPARLQQLADQIGLSPEKTIIVYDAEGGGWAGRLIWTLEVMGHTKCAYLNGGWTAWQAAALPVAQGLPDQTAKKASPTVQTNNKYIIDLKELLENYAALTIWDARSLEEYRGEKVLATKGGHIPGAVHLDWLDLIDPDNHLKLKAGLPALLAEKGLSPQAKIITHCQTHHRSGLTYLVARLLGYPQIRAYDGSWSEWGNHPETPVATGK